MAASKESKIVTATTEEELKIKVNTEIVEQGWQTEGSVIKNPDGTYSQKLVR